MNANLDLIIATKTRIAPTILLDFRANADLDSEIDFKVKLLLIIQGAYKQQKSKMSNFEGPYKENYLFYRFLP